MINVREGYSQTGNMRCTLHALGKFVFSGDAFGDPPLSMFVDPYDSIVDEVIDVQYIVECLPMM